MTTLGAVAKLLVAPQSLRIPKNPRWALGVLIGICLYLAYANLTYGVPVAICLMAIATKRFRIKKNLLSVLAVALLTISLSVIAADKRNDDLLIVLPHFINIALVSCAFFVVIDSRSVNGMETVASVALVLDLSINLFSLVSGHDPFGRVIDVRSDNFYRLNGLLGHPYLSVGVATIGFVAAISKRNYFVCALAILDFCLNQTGRSYTTIVVLLLFFVLTRVFKRHLRIASFSAILVLALSVYYMTLQSANPSNILRGVAWVNAIQRVPESPLLGGNGFTKFDPSSGVSEDALSESGVTENLYLELSLHLGIPVAILFLVVLAGAFSTLANRRPEHDMQASHRAALLLSFILLADSFYGNLSATFLVVAYFFLKFASNREDSPLEPETIM